MMEFLAENFRTKITHHRTDENIDEFCMQGMLMATVNDILISVVEN